MPAIQAPKKKPKYFTYISKWYSLSNRLEKAIYAYLRQEERGWIEGSDIELYQSIILEKIDDLNKKHPRCQPVKATWSTFNRNNTGDRDYPRQDIYLDLNNFSICHFELYEMIPTAPGRVLS